MCARHQPPSTEHGTVEYITIVSSQPTLYVPVVDFRINLTPFPNSGPHPIPIQQKNSGPYCSLGILGRGRDDSFSVGADADLNHGCREERTSW
jgi:hypothetical protein